MEKLSPGEKLRKEVREFMEGLQDVGSAEEALTQLVQLSTRLICQEGFEAHQRDYLGVGRYERGDGRRGYRSGYERGHLDTAEGRLEVRVPQVRGSSDGPYRCSLYDLLRGDSEMVERLATEMYARGLSTRDIEAAFTDEQGQCLLSRSKVSEVTEALWEEYEAFQSRDLSNIPLMCLFLDGLYEPLRTHGITREAVLCAWGITLDGRKVLISVALGNKESGAAWLEFLRDLDRRGLPTPLSVTTDGAGGLIQAVDQMWPDSLRGRCWVHRMRNFAAKVPESRWHEIKPYLLMIRDAPDLETGQKAVQEFLSKFSKEFPGLCKALTEDLDALLAHLQLPWRLRKFTRTTNLIERSFVEERRRTKTLPRFFTEKSCLKLVYAVLIRAAARWQTISITATEYLQLKMLYEVRGVALPPALEAVA
jgi:transposase-like protein